jgi:hypothetical protein
MFIFQIVGYVILCIASISSSVSMNFQKLAQHETDYHDPRTRLRPRKKKLKSMVCSRPLFIIALFLSAAASTLDFLALTWLPSITIGVFGSMSIIINLLVTRVILFEVPQKKEWLAIGLVIAGCLLSISVTPEGNSIKKTPPQLIERPQSLAYILLNWIVFITFSQILEYKKDLPQIIKKIGFPFIGGALGAQNVCMGKFIAYALSTLHSTGSLPCRLDVLVSVISLCTASIILHIVWLNKGLAVHDAYYCIIVYQTAWFMFTTLSGIVVYDNMAELSGVSNVIFILGFLTAAYGVWRVSKLHNQS